MFYLTIYLRLYGVAVGHNMVEYHSSKEESCCRLMGYSLRLAARDLLHAPSHRQDSTYMAFVIHSVEHWLERGIAQWVHLE